MTLKSSLDELEDSLLNLEQKLDDLVWAVDEGKPDGEEHAVADHYHGASHNFVGLAKAARLAAGKCLHTSEGQPDPISVRQWLVECQAQFNDLRKKFYSDYVPSIWIDRLNQLSRERIEWAGYCAGVKDALLRCPEPFDEVNETIFRCWQELTEQTNLFSVSTRQTSVPAPKSI
jgi:hypothetical protein